MRIIYFGTPDFAVPSLKALVEAGEDVVAVISQPDKLKGRGHKLTQPPVKEFAVSKGLHIIQPSGIRSDEFYKSLAELKPDVIVVVAYGRIFPQAILKLPRLGCINVHASLLPEYRGAAPIQRAIIHGEKTTGVTTMLMDEGLDTGDMLLKEEAEIKDEDNALTLSVKLSETGASLLIKTLSGLKDNSIKPVTQTGEPSYAPPLKKEDGRINWSLPAIEIFNMIRGTYPWPGAYCYLGKERINIIKARAIDNIERSVSAKIEKIAGEEIYVGTGRGILSVQELRPDGKKNMSAAAFMHGRRLKEGASFETI